MFTGNDGGTGRVEVAQHHSHALRVQLHRVGPEALPQFTQLFGRDRVHLAGQAPQRERPGKALILQQGRLLGAFGHRHGKARTAQLLLGAQVIQQARQNQAAFAAQAI